MLTDDDSARRGGDRCPECHHHALVALGTRVDHSRRWLHWGARQTQVYTCNACEAVVTLPHPRKH